MCTEASAAMLKVVETLGDPDTMNELLGIIAKAKEQAGGDEMQEKMAVMGTMLHKIREIMTPTLKEYGFEDTDMGSRGPGATRRELQSLTLTHMLARVKYMCMCAPRACTLKRLRAPWRGAASQASWPQLCRS